MTTTTCLRLRSPYLIFTADVQETAFAKTGTGIVYWRPGLVAGQLRFAGSRLDLGVPDMTVSAAAARGAQSLIIGVACIGGGIRDSWHATLIDAANAGLDVVSGMHARLESVPGLANAASKTGAALINVRSPAPNFPIGTGSKRSGRRLLTVGTDCAVGKKYTALAVCKAMQDGGMAATFRATGQTGIMIAGEGIPIDAVVADFVAGAAEALTPDNEAGHWDVIEGQGSLFHPSYAGVSLGLLHGSQPDAIVVCHDAGKKFLEGFDGWPVPDIKECIELNLRCGRLTNAAVSCVGVSVNTSYLPPEQRGLYLQRLSAELQLPCVDPIIDGCGALVTRIKSEFPDHPLDGAKDSNRRSARASDAAS